MASTARERLFFRRLSTRLKDLIFEQSGLFKAIRL